MRARAFNRKQVWTSSVWDLTRRQVTRIQYKVLSVAAVSLCPQEVAVEEARLLLLQEKLGRRWELIPEEV